MPRLRELQRAVVTVPPGRGETRRLTVTPDAVQAHSLTSAGCSRRQAPASCGRRWSRPKCCRDLRPPDRDTPRGTLLQVTNLGISVKDSPQSTLVFVTRLDTGAPVADARVAIVDAANRTRWRGTTDRDGVALAPALALRQSVGPRDLSFIVTAEKDGDVAFVGSNWNDDVKPSAWNINYDSGESGAVLRGSVFTDRGVYKEGEEVHVKAVLRDDTPYGMRLLPAGSALDVVVRDSRDREVDRRTVTVNRWSSAEWTWRVPGRRRARPLPDRDVPRRVTRPSNQGTGSSAARFSSPRSAGPTSASTRRSTADPAVLGSTLRGTVEAKYLFGGALGTRPVRWWFRREPVQQRAGGDSRAVSGGSLRVGYLPAYDARRSEGAPLPEKTETLGADGRATVALPTSPDGRRRVHVHVRGRRGGRVRPAHRQSRGARRASGVALRRDVAAADVRGHEDRPTVGVVAVDLAGRPSRTCR